MVPYRYQLRPRSGAPDDIFDSRHDAPHETEAIDGFRSLKRNDAIVQARCTDDQVRDMIDYSAKLGTEWQKHAMDTSRKLYSQFMPQR